MKKKRKARKGYKDYTSKPYLEIKPCPVKRMEVIVDSRVASLKYIIDKMDWLKKKGFDAWIKHKPEYHETAIIFEPE